MDKEIKTCKKIKIVYLITRCTECGPVELVYNIISNLDKNFEPYIVTLYPEKSDSIIDKFKELGVPCYCSETSKLDMLLGKTNNLKFIMNNINPDIVHSHGVFPDYVAGKLNNIKHIITLHCFMREDYVDEYGWLLGKILESIQLQAIKKSDKTVSCSQSLSNIIYNVYHLRLDFILNGINFSKYESVENKTEQYRLREQIGLPRDKTIFIYAARFIKRKNQDFLCEVFSNIVGRKLLVLLGKGPDYDTLKSKYAMQKNILFIGYKDNLIDYLNACDIYISPSKSEGLPAGALEALACGLPVVLSDIPQHCEIVEKNKQFGCVYKSGDVASCIECINYVSENVDKYYEVRGNAAKYFDAKIMSSNYQKEYISLINRIG